MRSELRCKVFHLNGVQTSLECKVNVKQMSRFVFPAGSLFYQCNVFIYKAISSFSFNQVFTRFVFPPLKRDFAKISDLTPQKWIIRRRLEAAHDLIKSGRKKVTEACFDVGFKNLSHFSKIYKETYGVAPSW